MTAEGPSDGSQRPVKALSHRERRDLALFYLGMSVRAADGGDPKGYEAYMGTATRAVGEKGVQRLIGQLRKTRERLGE